MAHVATKDFHLGDVLSITAGLLVSPRGISGVYDILNFVLSDNLFTHQLPRAARASKTFLVEQHPQLRMIDASTCTTDNWQAWLDSQVAAFGERLPIRAMSEPERDEAYRSCDPLKELVEMREGTDGIIAVEAIRG